MKITKEQAKLFMLNKHGLINDYKYDNKLDILELFKKVGCLQYDPIDICGRNIDLILFSRIKNYKKEFLYELLYKDRLLADQWDKEMSVYLFSDWKFLLRVRRRNANQYEEKLKEYNHLIKYVLDVLKKSEYINSNDLKIDIDSHFFIWRHKNLGKAILDYLYFKGEVIIHHKDRVKRYFALAKNHISDEVLNKEDPFKNDDDFHKFQIKRRIGSVGMLNASTSGAYLGVLINSKQRKEYIEELVKDKELLSLQIEGLKQTYYILKEDISYFDIEVKTKRVEFIAPLDNLLWDRKQVSLIFDFDYKWEIYHTPEKRMFAPYAMPLLYGTDLIGQIEMVVDRKSRTLIVKNIWYKGKMPKKNFLTKLSKRIKEFAVFNDCMEVNDFDTIIHIY